MKNILLLFVFINSYSQSDYKLYQLIYDTNITEFKNFSIKYDIFDKKFQTLTDRLFINDYKEPEVVEKLKIDDSLFYPNRKDSGLDGNYSFYKAFMYGFKIMSKNTLFLYNELYKNPNDELNELQFYLTGVLVIKNKDIFTSWISVSHTEIEGDNVKQSYLFNEYIIVQKTKNIDIKTQGKQNKQKLRCCVFKIHINGKLEKLNNQNGKKILNRWLLKNNFKY